MLCRQFRVMLGPGLHRQTTTTGGPARARRTSRSPSPILVVLNQTQTPSVDEALHHMVD